jgi:hypothetical protein
MRLVAKRCKCFAGKRHRESKILYRDPIVHAVLGSDPLNRDSDSNEIVFSKTCGFVGHGEDGSKGTGSLHMTIIL